MERLLLTVPEAAAEIPCGITMVYRMLGDGRLDGVKLDGKSLVTVASVRRLQQTLPKLTTPTAARLAARRDATETENVGPDQAA